jgi:hypothetical protein
MQKPNENSIVVIALYLGKIAGGILIIGSLNS